MTNEIYVLDNGVKRLATEDELTQHEAYLKSFLDAKAKEDADKAAAEVAKADLLARLGITADEAKLLLA